MQFCAKVARRPAKQFYSPNIVFQRHVNAVATQHKTNLMSDLLYVFVYLDLFFLASCCCSYVDNNNFVVSIPNNWSSLWICYLNYCNCLLFCCFQIEFVNIRRLASSGVCKSNALEADKQASSCLSIRLPVKQSEI